MRRRADLRLWSADAWPRWRSCWCCPRCPAGPARARRLSGPAGQDHRAVRGRRNRRRRAAAGRRLAVAQMGPAGRHREPHRGCGKHRRRIRLSCGPDGYTLLSSPPPPLVINQNLYPKLGFDPAKFEPIIVMAHVPNALIVNPRTLRASSVPELDRISAEESRKGHGGHAGQRDDLPSHRRTFPDDGQGEAAFHSLSGVGARAAGPARRRRRPDVRQSRRFPAARRGRQSQAARRGLAPAPAVASRRADDRGNLAGLRGGGLVCDRGAAEYAERRSPTRSMPT